MRARNRGGMSASKRSSSLVDELDVVVVPAGAAELQDLDQEGTGSITLPFTVTLPNSVTVSITATSRVPV